MTKTKICLYSIISIIISYSFYYWYMHLYLVEIVRSNVYERRIACNLPANTTSDYLFYPFYDGGIIINMCGIVFFMVICTIPFIGLYIIYKLYLLKQK